MSAAELYPTLVAFGLMTGVAAGLLGVGGGIMMVPFLVFAIGLTQHEAQATSLLAVLPTAVVASLVLRRRGVGHFGAAIRIGVMGAAGGAAGSLLALAIPGHDLRTIFAVFLGLIGIRLVRHAAVAP
jgi:uncharacterized membrane protein YfcA